MATRPTLDFDGITAQNAATIEQSYRLHKKEEKNPPKPPAAKPAAKQQQQAPAEFSTKDAQLLLSQVDKLTHEKEKAVREQEKLQTKKNALLLKYERYYRNKVLCNLLPAPRKLGPNSAMADIQFALAEVAQAIAVYRSGDFVATSVVDGAERIEQVLVKTGIAQSVGLPYLDGFVRKTWEPALESEMMQIEREEMVIELQDWFTAPWHMRMLYMTFRMAKAYSDGRALIERLKETKISNNSNPSPPQAPPPAADERKP